MKKFDKITDKINQLLLGNFSEITSISEEHDEADAIIVGLNMLGEHLAGTTVSLEQFMESESKLDKLVNVLSERVKEMNCLQSITQSLLNHSISFDKMLFNVVRMIPTGWDVPVNTCARIKYADYVYETSSFIETSWGMNVSQTKFNESITIEVYLINEPDEINNEYPFRQEKEKLLNLICMQILEALALHRNQTQLVFARNEAIEASQAKSEFLSSMSHELRTPLTAIIGFGQILEQTIKDEETKSYVSEITKAGDHLLELINDILDLSAIESGKLSLSLDIVSLQDIFSECLSLMTPLAEKRDLRIIQPSFENVVYLVKADYMRLKQVLLNLLSNAIKYNREGGNITLAVENRAENRLRITVSDTGMGINKLNQKQLFQKFNRIGAQTTTIEGTGIGLVITKNIIELMNGDIGFTSKEGQGSSFWIDIDKTEDEANINQNQYELIESTPDASEIVTNHKKILYIEDNPVNLRLVTVIIKKQSPHELISAPDGKLGLELAISLHPDLILLDINLPGIDGYEVLKMIKENSQIKNIPVIAVTANAMKSDIEKGTEAGFDDYVTKPIVVSDLLGAINKILD